MFQTIRTLVTIGVLVCGVSFRAGGQQSAAVRSIDSALRAGRYEQALRLARESLAHSPQDAQFLALEGLALAGLKRDAEALASFEGALRVAPDYLPALEGAAQLEYKAGSDRATALLERILKLRPREETAHAMRAVVAWRQRDCAGAVQHFAQSRSAIASQPEALQQYGVCLVRLKQPEAAAEVFRQLLALRPDDRLARRRLAAAEFMAQHYQAAADVLQPILAAGKGADAEVLALASEAYEAAGNTPRAVALLRQAIVEAPRNVKLYLDFASLCFVHESFQVGIDLVTLGLSQVPDSAALYLARGVLYAQLSQLDKADADFANAERFDPQQAGSSVGRVLAEFQHDDVGRALTSVQRELESHPDDAFLHYLLAEILAWQGAEPGSPEFQRAKEAALRALQLKPDLALARNVLSRLYLTAGQAAQAIEQCQLALRDNPADEVALYRLIRALKSTGKKEDAEQVPGLLKRFSEIRQKARQKEAQEHGYRLVEEGTPATGRPGSER